MVIAVLANLTEPLDQNIQGAPALLQQQGTYGLADRAALAFFKTGFADRVVVLELAAL